MRGTIAKDNVTKKILEVFEGSFVDGKVIRIPTTEDGETIQIKVQLTAAKDIITPDGNAVAAEVKKADFNWGDRPTDTVGPKAMKAGPSAAADFTEEEQANIKKLLDAVL